jgi:hypothetical protein
MAEAVTCLRCGMADPPPEMTCRNEMDHRISTGSDSACPNCGRLMLACARRPCSVMREQSYETGWADDGSEGSGAGGHSLQAQR